MLEKQEMNFVPALIIHAGAGVSPHGSMPAGYEEEIRGSLYAIVAAGSVDLARGASALDVAENAVRMMEDNPLFNAGKGAALTSEATVEHDAAIMDGRLRQAGAVTSVRRIRNPISAARAVMDQSPHVMLAGSGAEQFAREHGIEMAPEWYFFTERRLAALERVKRAANGEAAQEHDIHGTVGAVALDKSGNLAAATSTGGRGNKLPGRVGDSPIVGAGTYADNRYCGVSGTGAGEYFMRMVLAFRLANLIELGGLEIGEAARLTIEELRAFGGSGGLIAMDPAGVAIATFTGRGMHRGFARAGQKPEVAIHADEPFSPDRPAGSQALPN